MNATIEKILNEKIIIIVRGVPKDSLTKLGEALYSAGIRAMECTYDAKGDVSDEETAEGIGLLAKQLEGRMTVGAGTVLSARQVQLTAAAGGRFIISPDTNAEVITETKKLGLVSIPGALSASEATAAHRAGADFVKLFPISQLGSGYVKALCAPLSHIRFLAVGGVNSDSMLEYMKNGACGVGIGLNVEDKQAIARGDFDFIESKYREMVNKL